MIQTFRDIEYSLKRSRRKTATIYVERDGRVSVQVPESLTTEEIETLLHSKRRWIYRHLAEWEELNRQKSPREYVNGEGFLYLGRSYRLKLVPDCDPPLILKGGYFCLSTTHKSPAFADAAFKELYRDKGNARIRSRVEYFQTQMDVAPKSLRVMELKNRWGSCTPTGNLNFHWKCMMAPVSIIDYIVVHELAHLIHHNHSQAFWSEVDKVIPDYLDRKEWLRVNGAGMDL